MTTPTPPPVALKCPIPDIGKTGWMKAGPSGAESLYQLSPPSQRGIQMNRTGWTLEEADAIVAACVKADEHDHLAAECERLRKLVEREADTARRMAAGAVESCPQEMRHWFARKAARLTEALAPTSQETP